MRRGVIPTRAPSAEPRSEFLVEHAKRDIVSLVFRVAVMSVAPDILSMPPAAVSTAMMRAAVRAMTLGRRRAERQRAQHEGRSQSRFDLFDHSHVPFPDGLLEPFRAKRNPVRTFEYDDSLAPASRIA